MSIPRPQYTLAAPVEVSGFGYWSSLDVRLELRPAPAATGIVFVRSDLPGAPRVQASVANRINVPRRTNLKAGRATVEMVEHVMAALAGLHIDNCEVWCDAGEMPGPDGSSWPIVEAIMSAGVRELDAARRQVTITEPIRIEDDGAWVAVEPYNGLHLQYDLDYGPGPIGKQSFATDFTLDAFLSDLAPARTFILEEEGEYLRDQGLGLRATNRDLVVFAPDGPIDNVLRYEDECVRHKTLDMIGDLALGGCDFVGKFTASRSGHRLNAELVRQILQHQTTTHPAIGERG